MHIELQHEPEFIYIDLFCGAGGTTTGIHMAVNEYGKLIAIVAACVNHDKKAIKSHWRNHPEVEHFEEDITTLYGFIKNGIFFRSEQFTRLQRLIDLYRAFYPNAKIVLWASLECTNFSKAKGGQPRNADSRTLADHLKYYQIGLNPDYIEIENVVEFMSWGPLDANGKPVSRKNGSDWLRWREMLKTIGGYHDDWKELDSANFGAHTTRNRLFGCFAKPGLPIVWPEATHEKVKKHKKNQQNDLFGLFKKPWNPVKEVLDFSDEGKSIFNRKKPLSDKTLQVIANGLIKSINEGEDAFLFKYYGNGDNLNSINEPAGTLTTKDRFALILRQYKSGFTTSINEPLGTIPTTPKANLVSFIMNKSHGGHTTSVAAPCPVIVASQHKAPLYIIMALMDEHGIEDIRMRMLKVEELLRIQEFPEGYILEGNQTDKKKFIGNSVVPLVVKAWVEAKYSKTRHFKINLNNHWEATAA